MSEQTILVVDDEPQLRRVMRATLTDLGYIVIDAKTGEAALEKLHRDTPDVILLDLNICRGLAVSKRAGLFEPGRIFRLLSSRLGTRSAIR